MFLKETSIRVGLLNILVVPTTDWIGHPVVERQHQIFERLTTKHEVSVLRFRYYNAVSLSTKAKVYEIKDIMSNSLAKYYLLNVAKHYRAIEQIVHEDSIDVVVLSNLLPAFTAMRTLKCPTVFDLSDHFPSSAAGYFFDMRSIMGKLSSTSLEILLKHTLSRVDHTVACSYPLKDYAQSLNKGSKVTIIPNGVEKSFFKSVDNGNAIRQEYNLGKATVIGYIGMIEFWVNLSPLLQAINELKNRYPIKLFLIGKRFQSQSHLKILKEIEELNISDNIVWSKGWIPHAELPRYIAAMDLCTIPFDESHPTAYFSAPNKLWEYLAVGKPVITSPLPDVLNRVGCHVNIASSKQDYCRIIEDYIRSPEKYLEQALRSKKEVATHTWENVAEQYETLLKSVVDGKRCS